VAGRISYIKNSNYFIQNFIRRAPTAGINTLFKRTEQTKHGFIHDDDGDDESEDFFQLKGILKVKLSP
jgi:hypothetical protein